MSDIELLTRPKQILRDVEITFQFGAEPWQGKVLSVQDVCACEVPTGIPHVPVYIRGSINIAGWVAPVLDIHQYCGLTPQTLHTKQVAVVQFEDNAQDRLMHMVTQSFNEPPKASRGNEGNQREISSSLFVGISIIDGQLVVLMDAKQLQQQEILEEADDVKAVI
ncbi:MAG: chemotaxis protein CheW [Ghiorsea sp.]